MTPSPASRATARSRPHRGVALLLVVASIAVLTALTVELAYSTRVSAQLAANARDELQAYYLAKGGVNLSRLVLHFQQKLETSSAQVAGFGGARISVRLWEIVPVGSATVGYLGGGELPRAERAGGPARGFGGFAGTFEAKVEDEERKVNLGQFDAGRALALAQAARLAELLKDPTWDFLFDRDDANGIRVGRKELFAAVRDWADADENGSVFTGNPAKPFEDAFTDENGIYDRLADRYKAKNGAYDSVDELYMVAGITDAFMAAFGDRLTVYPDVNATINVNTSDPRELLLNAVVMGGGVLQPATLDPSFLERLQAALAPIRPVPFLGITVTQFAQVLQGLGVQVAPECLSAGNPGCPFSDRSGTFRIRSTGKSGEVTKALEAVVTFDRRALGLEKDLGRLIHWHEE